MCICSKGRVLIGVATAITVGAAGVSLTKAASNRPPSEARMARRAATAQVGMPAPDFTLNDVNGKAHTLSDLTKEGDIVVLEWFNPDCPYIMKHHQRYSTMIDLEARHRDQNVVWLAINSGAEGKQGFGAEYNKAAAERYHMEYPVLMDQNSEVGRAYGARTTPHMFIINKDGVIAYSGAIDNNRSAVALGDVNYVEQALSEIIAGETVVTSETRPYGCGVKYAR